MINIPKSAKITIDSKGANLKAVVSFSDDDDITLDNVDSINTLLRSIYEKESINLADLINSRRLIIKSARVWNNYTIMNGKFFYSIKNKDKETVLSNSTVKPVVETHEEKPVFNPADIYELVAELKKLNPDVELEVNNNIIYSSLAGEKLVLPNGFVYNEKNGINNKHLTESGAYMTFDVKDISLLPKEEASEDLAEAIINEDGSFEPIVNSEVVPVEETKEEKKTEKGKKSKWVKKLKTGSIIALTAIVGGYIIHGGLKNAFKNNAPKTESKRIETSLDGTNYETTYNTSDEEVIYGSYDEALDTSYGDQYEMNAKYANYGSVVEYDDMETQIQTINDLCFGYKPCSLQNLVIDSDRDAINTINNMRDRVLNGTCYPELYLNNIVNYLFESGTIFDGKIIKTYDSLSPYAQYIVLVASQSILQNCPKYEHNTNYNSYNYSVLTNSFNYMVDEEYRYLTNQSSKTR